MTGLVIKDLLVGMKTIRSYAMVVGIYAVMAVLKIFNFAFVSAFVSVMLIMLPVGAFSYDDQAKWDRYALALPLGRRRVVGSRYLFTLLVALGSVALSAVMGVVSSVITGESFVECVASSFGSLGAGLVIVAVLLPLCYKLGPERARPYLYALIFLPILAMFLAVRMGVRVDTSWLDRLEERNPLALLGLIGLFPLGGLAAMVPSWLISCRVMEHREF